MAQADERAEMSVEQITGSPEIAARVAIDRAITGLVINIATSPHLSHLSSHELGAAVLAGVRGAVERTDLLDLTATIQDLRNEERTPDTERQFSPTSLA